MEGTESPLLLPWWPSLQLNLAGHVLMQKLKINQQIISPSKFLIFMCAHLGHLSDIKILRHLLDFPLYCKNCNLKIIPGLINSKTSRVCVSFVRACFSVYLPVLYSKTQHSFRYLSLSPKKWGSAFSNPAGEQTEFHWQPTCN